MANRKDLKKNIEELTWEVIDYCSIAELRFPEITEEKIQPIINRACDMYDEFIKRVNNVDGKNDPKLVRTFFKKLNVDLKTTYTKLIEEAQNLSK